MAACRACGATIEFKETASGKLMPTDPDGTSHFATCSDAAKFRKPEHPRDECHACHSRHVENLPGKGPHHGAIRCLDCGTLRWLRKPTTA
jgi:hypothetical protein